MPSRCNTSRLLEVRDGTMCYYVLLNIYAHNLGAQDVTQPKMSHSPRHTRTHMHTHARMHANRCDISD